MYELYYALKYAQPDALLNTVESAKNYLKNLSGNIRLIVTEGPGFGDQTCAITIIEYIKSLGFRGAVDIVGHSFKNKPREIQQESPLLKTMKLLNIKPDNNFTVQYAELTDRMRVRFIDYSFFKNNLQFQEVELGIFVGPEFLLAYYGHSNVDASLVSITHSKSAIIFNPFTKVSVQRYPREGFAFQLQNQTLKRYYASKILPYRVVKPQATLIQRELAVLQNTSSVEYATLINHIIDAQSQKKINTFMLYGLNPLLHPQPEYSLLNLILAGIKANEHSEPLIVLVMNSISDQSWNNLQALFNAKKPPKLANTLKSLPFKIQFINVFSNHTADILTKHPVVVLRMQPLPRHIFNKLYVESTLMPTAEGANAITLLNNYQRYSLPCKKQEARYPINIDDLPHDLKQAIPYICTDNGLLLWLSEPTPDNVISPLIKKYSNLTQPALLEPDRVTFALSELSQQKNCSLAPSHCAFYKPFENTERVLSLCKETGIKSVLYAGSEEITKSLMVNALNLDPNIASMISFFLRLILQLGVDGTELVGAILFLSSMFCHTVLETLPDSRAKNAFKIGLLAVLTLAQLAPSMMNFEWDNVILLTSLMLLSLSADVLTRSVANNTQTFFSQHKKLTPLSEPKPTTIDNNRAKKAFS